MLLHIKLLILKSYHFKIDCYINFEQNCVAPKKRYYSNTPKFILFYFYSSMTSTQQTPTKLQSPATNATPVSSEIYQNLGPLVMGAGHRPPALPPKNSGTI